MKTRFVTGFIIVAMTFGAASLGAQELQPLRLDNTVLPKLLSTLPTMRYSHNALVLTRTPRTDAADKKLKTVAVALYGAMLIDTKSTFDTRARCPRCVETDPFAAPFVNAGPVATYSAGIAFDTGLMVLAAKMRKSANPVIRRIWFVAPVALTVGHVAAARHNYAVRRSCATSLDCGTSGPR